MHTPSPLRRSLGLACLAWLAGAAPARVAELKPKTVEAWERHVALTEERIERELASGRGFLVQDFFGEPAGERCRAEASQGKVCIVEMQASSETVEVPGGLIHHWMGSIFVPGANLESLLAWVKDYDEHHRFFDEVEASRLIARDGERFEMFLRLKRTKILTLHYNTTPEVMYRRHSPSRASSMSRTTRIAELENAGQADEREKTPGEERGFLWRLNSYWRFEEREGGVAVSCESLSLSRGLPFGVGWLIKGYIKSVPRESMEATLVGLREGYAKSRTAASQASDPRP